MPRVRVSYCKIEVSARKSFAGVSSLASVREPLLQSQSEYHNAPVCVFAGKDESGTVRFAAMLASRRLQAG
jgi:hypothetical protein